MATINLQLPDEMKASLETRAREARYDDVADYLRDMIRADLEQAGWEITPAIAAALDEAEASGYEPYDFKSIVAEARTKFRAE